MKKLLSVIAALFLLGSVAKAQDFGPGQQKPNIEVVGTAEMEVIPDKIYMSITLRERYEGKEKITIDAQEKEMKKRLLAAGIDLTNLTLSDANADYVQIYYKKKDKDALNSKTYQLLLSKAEQVGAVFEAVTDLKIYSADITKVDHSKIQEFRKNLRIEAMKAAKDKATYMLAAIGEEPGKPIYVNDESYDYQPVYAQANMMYKGAVQAESAADGAAELPETQFQKIKLKVQVRVKFEIK